jgi:trimethylamine--corrinoid protein Co-methyltransferase
LDVIREVGHGGSYLGHDHTTRHFRKELFFPSLFRRETIAQWLEGGKKLGHQLAHERVEEILAEAGPVDLPPGADAELERALNKVIGETIGTS